MACTFVVPLRREPKTRVVPIEIRPSGSATPSCAPLMTCASVIWRGGLRPRWLPARARGPAPAHRRRGPVRGLAQQLLIRREDRAEPRVRAIVEGVDVGVIPARELAVPPLDRVGGRVRGEPQELQHALARRHEIRSPLRPAAPVPAARA